MKGMGSRGFTLVDLMIAIVIGSILAAVAIPQFKAFLLNMQIRTATEAINNGLQLAKGEAVRRNTNVRFVLGSGTSWSVGCDVAQADNDGDGVEDCPTTIQSRATSEGSASTVLTTNPSGATIVTFNGFGRVVANSDGTASITQFDIDVPTSLLAAEISKNLRILVSGGTIRVCDPNNAIAGDARAC
ncbi:MAG TPA: GspH/FimT family pseudopilin [Methylophilaceae bacterium]|nr:GspH/FimT family pseudopilin [Methylophilaceae bacterium]